MSLRIRLARGGAKKRPFYRIVVAEATSPRDGRFVEKVGTYNPMLPQDHADRVILNNERIQHWLGVGAQPTDRVARFLSVNGLSQWKAGSNPKKAEPKTKAKERAAERADRAEKAAAAAAAPAEEAAATAE